MISRGNISRRPRNMSKHRPSLLKSDRLFLGAPAEIRTPDTLLKRHSLVVEKHWTFKHFLLLDFYLA